MKKETILKSVMLLLVMTMAMGVKAQTHWNYSYDNTGNRTLRVVTTGSSARQKAASASLIDDGKVTAIFVNNRKSIKVETLSYSSSDVADAYIYDLSGIQLMSKRIEAEITTLDLEKLRKGTYILTIELNGETRSCKFNK